MSVLVTGAAGFMGLNLVEELCARNAKVVALDARAVPQDRSASEDTSAPSWVVADIRNREAVEDIIRSYGVERIIHAAAITPGPERERDDPSSVVAVNLGGLTALLEVSHRAGLERFVNVGSVAAYGPAVADGELITEQTPQVPAALYGITKSAGEKILARFAHLTGLSAVTGRLGVLFGRHERESGMRDTMSPFLHTTRKARAGEAVVLPRPARRNWHYARDAAKSLITLAYADAPSYCDYNLGPEAVWTLAQWCDRLSARFPRFSYSFGDVDGAEIGLHLPSDGGLLSWQRFSVEFGPTARFGLEEAFADYLDWLERDPG